MPYNTERPRAAYEVYAETYKINEETQYLKCVDTYMYVLIYVTYILLRLINQFPSYNHQHFEMNGKCATLTGAIPCCCLSSAVFLKQVSGALF